MKALLLRGLLYVAKVIIADVVKKKLESKGQKEGADLSARLAEGRVDFLADLVK